jgi:hypothetical protein
MECRTAAVTDSESANFVIEYLMQSSMAATVWHVMRHVRMRAVMLSTC